MNIGTKYFMDDTDWTMVIHPQRAWWDLRLGDLWRYRDLILLFVRRDFVAYYKQTILGPFWYLIQPIITTGVYSVVFGNIAKLSTDGVPTVLFYLAGTTVWSYFSSCLTSTSNTFVNNATIFGKVYFPRLSIPVSVIISNLISFGIRFGLFLAFFAYFLVIGADIHPNFWILSLPFLILLMAGLGLGLGIIVSSLTTKYRDLQQLVGFGVQLLMYATPVIYPLSTVENQWRWLFLINPMTSIVEVFRLAFFGVGTVELLSIVYSVVSTAIIFLIGALIFNHVESTFIDTV